MLEKTLESPLDSKKIKPINPKGNPPWIFIRRTDAKAETPILGHLMQKADSLEKILMLGNIEGMRRTGWQRNGHEFDQTLGDSEGQGNLVRCAPWDRRVGHNLATEPPPSPMLNPLACLHSPWVIPSSLRICLSTSQLWVLAAKLVPHDPCSLSTVD